MKGLIGTNRQGHLRLACSVLVYHSRRTHTSEYQGTLLMQLSFEHYLYCGLGRSATAPTVAEKCPVVPGYMELNPTKSNNSSHIELIFDNGSDSGIFLHNREQ